MNEPDCFFFIILNKSKIVLVKIFSQSTYPENEVLEIRFFFEIEKPHFQALRA
jgi:hypothetical protein